MLHGSGLASALLLIGRGKGFVFEGNVNRVCLPTPTETLPPLLFHTPTSHHTWFVKVRKLYLTKKEAERRLFFILTWTDLPTPTKHRLPYPLSVSSPHLVCQGLDSTLPRRRCKGDTWGSRRWARSPRSMGSTPPGAHTWCSEGTNRTVCLKGEDPRNCAVRVWKESTHSIYFLCRSSMHSAFFLYSFLLSPWSVSIPQKKKYIGEWLCIYSKGGSPMAEHGEKMRRTCCSHKGSK